jgi:hypothetical protein
MDSWDLTCRSLTAVTSVVPSAAKASAAAAVGLWQPSHGARTARVRGPRRWTMRGSGRSVVHIGEGTASSGVRYARSRSSRPDVTPFTTEKDHSPSPSTVRTSWTQTYAPLTEPTSSGRWTAAVGGHASAAPMGGYDGVARAEGSLAAGRAAGGAPCAHPAARPTTSARRTAVFMPTRRAIRSARSRRAPIGPGPTAQDGTRQPGAGPAPAATGPRGLRSRR